MRCPALGAPPSAAIPAPNLPPSPAAAPPQIPRSPWALTALPLPAARMRIVDDDVSWNSIAAAPDKEEEEEDEGDMPVVSGESRQARSHTLSLFWRSLRVSLWKELARAPLPALCWGGCCLRGGREPCRKERAPCGSRQPALCGPARGSVLQNSC